MDATPETLCPRDHAGELKTLQANVAVVVDLMTEATKATDATTKDVLMGVALRRLKGDS